MQRLERRAVNRENPGSNRLVSKLWQFRSSHVATVKSAVKNKYLSTDRGGYVNEYSSRSNCSVAECFPDKSRWRWNEQVC